jgi:hypothetical protein
MCSKPYRAILKALQFFNIVQQNIKGAYLPFANTTAKPLRQNLMAFLKIVLHLFSVFHDLPCVRRRLGRERGNELRTRVFTDVTKVDFLSLFREKLLDVEDVNRSLHARVLDCIGID